MDHERKHRRKRVFLLPAAALLLFCLGCGTGPERQPEEPRPGAGASDASSDASNEPALFSTAAPADETSERLPKETGTPETNIEEEAAMRMKVQVNGQTFDAVLEENTAVEALAALLEDGPLTLAMRDYSGFEKVGPLGQSLPASNSQTTTRPGDIVLYNGDQIVIFYGSNSWSYTRLGHIEDLTGWEDALGGGDVSVTFGLG